MPHVICLLPTRAHSQSQIFRMSLRAWTHPLVHQFDACRVQEWKRSPAMRSELAKIPIDKLNRICCECEWASGASGYVSERVNRYNTCHYVLSSYHHSIQVYWPNREKNHTFFTLAYPSVWQTRCIRVIRFTSPNQQSVLFSFSRKTLFVHYRIESDFWRIVYFLPQSSVRHRTTSSRPNQVGIRSAVCVFLCV